MIMKKAVKKNNLGLNPKQKIIMQLSFSLAFAVFAMFFSGGGFVESTCIWIPVADVTLDLGYFLYSFCNVCDGGFQQCCKSDRRSGRPCFRYNGSGVIFSW